MKNRITWFQINNALPIITSLILMALAFGSLKSDVALLSQKLDTVIVQQEKQLAKQEVLEEKYNMLSIKVEKLATQQQIKTGQLIIEK